MKTRYLLFLTSGLCGLALSFAYLSYGHVYGAGASKHPVSQSTPVSSPASIIDDQTAFHIATRLVSDRDAALVDKNHEALQALTVPDSPARRFDDALFDTVDGLSSLETVVLDVHVRDATEWEVYSIQQEIVMSDGHSGSARERCTVWHMEKNPWRLYGTSECAQHM